MAQTLIFFYQTAPSVIHSADKLEPFAPLVGLMASTPNEFIVCTTPRVAVCRLSQTMRLNVGPARRFAATKIAGRLRNYTAVVSSGGSVFPDGRNVPRNSCR